MARWSDVSSDSEQELISADWFLDDPGVNNHLTEELKSETPSGSASSTDTAVMKGKRQKTGSDGEFELVDAPTTAVLQLRRKAPAEVKEADPGQVSVGGSCRHGGDTAEEREPYDYFATGDLGLGTRLLLQVVQSCRPQVHATYGAVQHQRVEERCLPALL